MATPWFTSADLITSVKRKVAFPTSQSTFQNEDILAFANEEMAISQVPSVLSFHEEYFVVSEVVPLRTNVSRYPIPTRAIGMRLRDIFWMDQSGNLFDMTRIDAHQKAYFQANIGANIAIHKYYIENNDVVLVPTVGPSPTGSIVFYYFIRPNQLVELERVTAIESFSLPITVTNSSLVAGDTLTFSVQEELQGAVVEYEFTAVASSPGSFEFEIGATSTITATNLASAITDATISTGPNLMTAAVLSAGSNICTPAFYVPRVEVTSSNSSGLLVSSTNLVLNCDVYPGSTATTAIPSNIVSGSKIDFLQTLPGHKILDFSIPLPSGSVSGSTITLPRTLVPEGILIGDYIASENECVIPMLPDDLHNGLAERTAGRILTSLGDQQGLGNTQQKIQEINSAQGMLLDNRNDGTPQKVLARNSLIRYGKLGTLRRL